MQTKLFAFAAAALLATHANADVVAQWNFNSVAPDNNTSTGTLLPSVGAGAASLVGGTSATFASGAASGGSSDRAASDDSGWNLSTFATQGTGDMTRGAQFSFSTVGFASIVFSYDLRHRNSSAANEVVRVSVDNGASFSVVGSFVANSGDTWFNGRSVDLSAVAGAAGNGNLIVQVLAGFGDANGYLASNPANSYGTTGTWRFDMVTLNGVAAIPEPGTYALMLAGLGAIGFLARRRKA